MLMPPAAALALVPGLGPDLAPLAVERLPDGAVNDVYRVDTRAGSFVLRVDGAEWRRPGVDRGREALLHAAAAAAGLAPPIVCMRPEWGVLVTEFLPGEMWSPESFTSADRLGQLGERLGRLHALPAPAAAPFDPLALAHTYIAAATRRARPSWFATRAACDHVLEELSAAGRSCTATSSTRTCCRANAFGCWISSTPRSPIRCTTSAACWRTTRRRGRSRRRCWRRPVRARA
jgi:aminoglycoside phosphotransferase (APT) family kinase protein